MKEKKYFFTKSLIIFLAFVFLLPSVAHAQPEPIFPKRANYFLKWTMTEAEAKELSRFDLVVLDMEIQARQPELLKKMREWNPHIVLLAYITPEEIKTDAAGSYSLLRRSLAQNIAPGWYLYDTSGNKLSWWPGTYLLNMSANCPSVNGKQLSDYIADFAVNTLWKSGLWDGIFYDNAWDNITYFTKGSAVDENRDGVPDQNPDQSWRLGMHALYQKTRALAGPSLLIVGNGLTQEYKNDLDGNMYENFNDHPWNDIMGAYKKGAQEANHKVDIVNANTKNTGDTSYRAMRFGMMSALMENGYFGYDQGDTSHEQLWWYDEYNADLGRALGNAQSINNVRQYVSDIWRRDFERGIAVVNSTDAFQTVYLGGDFEKLKGTQDPTVNNGRIVNEVTLGAKDGTLLLRTVDQLVDSVFINGSFVRMYRGTGDRARNGFFSFEPLSSGGDIVAHIDVNGDGIRDSVLASQNKIIAHRDDGQTLFTVYPYTASYTGQLRLTIADINNDGKKEIIVAPNNGQKQPVKMYTLDGEKIGTDWYPFGNKYSGGYSIGVGDIDGSGKQVIVVGSGVGMKAELAVFGTDLKKIKSLPVFDKQFKGGVLLGMGDINKDGKSEMVIAPASGRIPSIQVLNSVGKQIYKEFKPFSKFVTTPIDLLQVGDIDGDGLREILVFTKGAF